MKIFNEIKILQEQMGNIMMEEGRENNKIMYRKYFEGADKPIKLLAWQIKKKRGKAIITKLKIGQQEILEP